MGTAIMASLLSRAALATEKLALRSPKKVLSPACVSVSQRRDLSVHEHVSMSLLQEAGVPVPKFGVAHSSAEAKKIAEDIATSDLVVEARVPSKEVTREESSLFTVLMKSRLPPRG